jgi:nucleoporin NUP159
MPKSTFSGFFPKPSETKTIKPVDEEESPVAEEAPLPPDFTTWKPPKGADDDLPPLAGSPGVKVEAPSSDGIPSSPLEDNEDDESVLEDEEGEEEEEESQPSTEGEQKAPAKANIFGKANDTSSPRIRPAAPTPPAVSSQATPPSLFGQTPKPSSTSIFQASATPAGFPKFQAPPSRRHENLRSPSPVRSASTSILQTRRQPPFPAAETLSSSVQQAATPPIAQPELSDLYDEEDERIRLELATEPEPSASLADFIAHSDYSGAVSKTGTAAQIEIMYRDMNSMVDTIGLNARSMKAFIAHHADRRKITRHDLDGITEQGEHGPWFDDWSLAQIEDLKLLEHELERDLDEGRIQGVIDKLGQLARLLLDKAKLMTKLNDIRRQILNRKDPERQEALLKAALPKELAEQQKTLRNEYAQLLSLLGKAEEAAYLLKSKLASINAANGRPSAVPTVDAVKKTINTLIRMTEKKNSEIVAMEDQLRRFMGDSHRQNGTPSRSHGTPSRTLGTPSRSARSILRQSSPLATPPTNRSRMSLSELNRTVQTPEPDETPSKGYGLYYTPDSSPKADGAGRLAKLADDLDDADMAELVAASQRRRQVADVLGNAVRKRGVKVTKVANVTKVA